MIDKTHTINNTKDIRQYTPLNYKPGTTIPYKDPNENSAGKL